MSLRGFYYGSKLLRTCFQSLTGVRALQARTAASSWDEGDKATMNTGKQKCQPVMQRKPSYYKELKPCKTDLELAAAPSLGYARCDVPFKPGCTHKCMFSERLDAQFYRPSKSLHRTYQVHWVECVPVAKVRVCHSGTVPAEVNRRPPKLPMCSKFKPKMCFPVEPTESRPHVPSPSPYMPHCIKFPLCESPVVAKPPNCVIQPKPVTCQRPRTRYPSFSEYIYKAILRPSPISECHRKVMLCEAWRSFERRAK